MRMNFRKILFVVPMLLTAVVLTGCLGGGGSSETKKEIASLHVIVSGNGTVSLEPGVHKVEKGAMVDLKATPDPDWEFYYWIGPVSDPYSAETTALVENDEQSVVAVFYNENESTKLVVRDEHGEPQEGVVFTFTDGSHYTQTNRDGEGILNTSAVDTFAQPSLGSNDFEPRVALVGKGEEVEFVMREESVGFSTMELTFNVADFSTGKLNPFSNQQIREAMNWLVDRDHIAAIYDQDGKARPMYTVLHPDSFDYYDLKDTVDELVEKYRYNKEAAREVIDREMRNMGAELVDGRWYYNEEQVQLIFIIREEDQRRDIGDYIADELEEIGFAVKRDYMNGQDAGPIWITDDPSNGKWHLYTGGWSGTVRGLQNSELLRYYTPFLMQGYPLWASYESEGELCDIALDIFESKFDSVEQRRQVFKRGLKLSMEYSVRIWLTWKEL